MSQLWLLLIQTDNTQQTDLSTELDPPNATAKGDGDK